ncbi:hypothetical protein NMY22_g11382 [Coprinellus aureogranulatus]|nr:hypothetical protein NMY22_g11382 [Coprinellus aureogranulatus]
MPTQIESARFARIGTLDKGFVGKKLRVAGRLLGYDAIRARITLLDADGKHTIVVDVSEVLDETSSRWVNERLGTLIVMGYVEESPTVCPLPAVSFPAPPSLLFKAILVVPAGDLDLKMWDAVVEAERTATAVAKTAQCGSIDVGTARSLLALSDTRPPCTRSPTTLSSSSPSSPKPLSLRDYIDEQVELAVRAYADEFQELHARHSAEEIKRQIQYWKQQFEASKRLLPPLTKARRDAEKKYNKDKNADNKKALDRAKLAEDKQRDLMEGNREQLEYWQSEKPSRPGTPTRSPPKKRPGMK